MSRASELFTKTPLANLIIIGSCSLAFVYQIVGDPNLVDYTMCPRNVLYLHEFYRIITSALFHGSIMHLGMNMMSTYAIGNSLERRFGTFYYFLTVMWGIVLTSFIYMIISVSIFWIFDVEGPFLQHSVGFSGVIFQLSVLESDSSPDTHRSVFGFVSVPIMLYPWALLIAAQFIMPNISFLGHLSGILVGTLQTFNMLTYLLPKPIFLRELENSSNTILQGITTHISFKPIPSDDALNTLLNCGENASDHGPYKLFLLIFTFIMNILETIKVIIFGRDNRSDGHNDTDFLMDHNELDVDNDATNWVRQSDINNNNNNVELSNRDHRMV